MKKFVAIALVTLISFAGCNMMKLPVKESASGSGTVKAPPQESKPEETVGEDSDSENSDSGSAVSEESSAPDKAVEELLSNINDLDDAKIEQLAGEYFAMEEVPAEYYSLIKPIASRVSYKIGSYKIDGDKAAVDVSVTAIDARSALNKAMPGAVAHLAALQITGKDVSNPEKILAEYAAKNIDWGSLPTIKTDATLYLVKGADGEWKADVGNPDNLDFANAVSGGALEVAQSLKELADRFK